MALKTRWQFFAALLAILGGTMLLLAGAGSPKYVGRFFGDGAGLTNVPGTLSNIVDAVGGVTVTSNLTVTGTIIFGGNAVGTLYNVLTNVIVVPAATGSNYVCATLDEVRLALTNSTAGDSVTIAAGTYNLGDITPSAGIIITGAGTNSTILQGRFSWDGNGLTNYMSSLTVDANGAAAYTYGNFQFYEGLFKFNDICVSNATDNTFTLAATGGATATTRGIAWNCTFSGSASNDVVSTKLGTGVAARSYLWLFNCGIYTPGSSGNDQCLTAHSGVEIRAYNCDIDASATSGIAVAPDATSYIELDGCTINGNVTASHIKDCNITGTIALTTASADDQLGLSQLWSGPYFTPIDPFARYGDITLGGTLYVPSIIAQTNDLTTTLAFVSGGRIVLTAGGVQMIDAETTGQDSVIIGKIGSDVDFTVNSASQIEMFLNGASGNLGIGTTTTPGKLTVAGDIRSSGTITSTNTITATNFVFSIPRWTDALATGFAIKLGANAPTLAQSNPNDAEIQSYFYGYGDDARFEVQSVHSLARTNAAFPNFYFEPHLHCMTTTTASGTNATFRLKLDVAVIRGSFTNVAVYSRTNSTTLTNAYSHYMISFGNITNNLLQGHNSVLFRGFFERLNGGDGDIGSGTLVSVESIDIHVPLDQIGSSPE